MSERAAGKPPGIMRSGLLLFLLIWTLINTGQALSTGLLHDEAYYWMWGKFPAWGYFDHPPMVAVFTGLGALLVVGELGVRLFSILASTASLWMLFEILERKGLATFVLITLSMMAVHVGGFIAAPDSALMCFLALFFLSFKHYLANDSRTNAMAVMLAMALVMYSKYHGAFALALTVASNPRLFRRRSYWWVLIGAALLYVPHLLWLFTTGTASLEYNLGSRLTDPWRLRHVLDFLGGQLLLTGPLICFLTIPAAIRQRSSDAFTYTLKVVMVGIFAIFLLFALRGHVEANWTASAFIPLILLATRFIRDRSRWRRVLWWLAIPSVLLLCTIRIDLITKIIPWKPAYDKTEEMRNWPAKAQKVFDLAEGRHVVANNFQYAAKLSFYGDTIVPCLRTTGRPSQYDLWSLMSPLEGQNVLFLADWVHDGKGALHLTDRHAVYPVLIEQFTDYNEVTLAVEEHHRKMGGGMDTTLAVKVQAPDGKILKPGVHTILTTLTDGDGNTSGQSMTTLPAELTHNDTCHISLRSPVEAGCYSVHAQLVSREKILWRKQRLMTICVGQDR